MSVSNLSTANIVVTVNGRIIDDWGDSDPAFTHEPIDPKSVLRRGQGGNAVRLDRINPGRRVTLNLNPGSQDASFMQGLFNSNANIELSYVAIGTLENTIGIEGVIVNDGSTGRGGQTITDNQFIIEFNNWTESK
jgi:hypothetical protein